MTTLPPAFLAQLKNVDAPLLTDPEQCWVYGYDNSRLHSLPQAVILPTTHEQIIKIVQACYQFNIPLTVRGRGTNTTGATVPLKHGVVMSLERMTQILDFSPDNRYIRVQTGITNQQLQDFLKPHGFFWSPDPSSAAFCTVGGNLGHNAAGPRTIKYGSTRDNTLGLRAITGDAKDFHTGVYTTKGVVGYDLTRLLIGSEGTLAIITEATLKLTPLPEAKKTIQAIYQTVTDAAHAVSNIMAQPIIPCALEFIDGNALNLIRKDIQNLPDNAGALLMIEIDGASEGLNQAAEKLMNAANNQGLINIQLAKTDDEVATLWQTRKALSPALRNIAPKKINEDIVVPVTHIPALIAGLDKLSKKYQLPIVNFGHAGNGNIHTNILVNPDIPEQNTNAEACLNEMFTLVLNLNGTLSGEHGVGIAKRDFIHKELDSTSIELMRAIKQQFDPRGILNPDKLLPLATHDRLY